MRRGPILPPRLRRWLGYAVPIALACALAVGFADFTKRVNALTPPAEEALRADAIVALTGGSRGRLDTSLDLLREGRGRRLLISGVNQDLSDQQLSEGLSIEPELAACCVDFGRYALDTLGNATETAAWAERHQYDHLILVTDDYHMPRSFIELRLAMPNVRLVPFPVATTWSNADTWWRDPAACGRMAVEYAKFLFVAARERVVELLRPSQAQAAEPSRGRP